MQYLIEMKLSGSARPKDPHDEIFFIERYIFPSVEIFRKWQAEGKLLAGGPVSASIQLAFVLEVESDLELDALVESLPLWPLMETTVTPLTTFEGRIQAVQSKLKRQMSPPAQVVNQNGFGTPSALALAMTKFDTGSTGYPTQRIKPPI